MPWAISDRSDVPAALGRAGFPSSGIRIRFSCCRRHRRAAAECFGDQVPAGSVIALALACIPGQTPAFPGRRVTRRQIADIQKTGKDGSVFNACWQAGEPKPPTRAERGRVAASDRRFSKGWKAIVAATTAVNGSKIALSRDPAGRLRPARPRTPVLQPLRRRRHRRRRRGRPAGHAQRLPERPAPRWQGDRALFLRRADTVRHAVARIMNGLSRCLQRERPGTQPPAKVHAAREQAAGRLTSGKATETGPRLPAHARSAGAFLSERRENYPECHCPKPARFLPLRTRREVNDGECRRTAAGGPRTMQGSGKFSQASIRPVRHQAPTGRWRATSSETPLSAISRSRCP